MKKVLGIMVVLSAFLIGAPHQTDAQGRHLGWYKHRERVRVIYRRPVVYRRYYYSEPVYYYHPHHRIHIHVPGVGGDAGVHVGPIHLGAGVHLNEVMPPPAGPAVDPTGLSAATSQIEFMPAPDTVQDVVSPEPHSIPRVQAQYITLNDRFALSPDTNANDYYVMWQAPSTVTVDGFDVPVTGTVNHFQLFRHGRNGVMRLHNHKGEDSTMQYGISPRGGSIPESIDGNAYSITSKEQ